MKKTPPRKRSERNVPVAYQSCVQSLLAELKALNKELHEKNERLLQRNENLEKLHAELLNLLAAIEERSDELLRSREELQLNKRLADIGILATTVAHELRTPLATINIATANIRKKSSESVMLDPHLQTINKKVLESDQIIKNLLSYARIQSPSFEKVDLRGILLECAGLVTHRKEQGTVRKSLGSLKNITIDADPLQLRELFSNLFNNAYDAFHEGKGILEIRGSSDKNLVKIVVKDDGVGIKDGNLEHIFNPFFTTKAKGTGLGLTVCQQIVLMHKGTIGIKSSFGQGAIVTVTLPAKKEHKRWEDTNLGIKEFTR